MTTPKKKKATRAPKTVAPRAQPNCRDDNELIMASQIIMLNALAEIVHYLAPSDRATQEKLWAQEKKLTDALKEPRER